MADKSQRRSKNIDGKYYVDENCIDCGICYQMASNYFAHDEGEFKAYVYHQPASDMEIANCEEVMGHCPVNAIGNDG